MARVGFFKRLSSIRDDFQSFYKQEPKKLLLFFLVLIFALAFIMSMYSILDYVNPNEKDVNLIARGIESPIKLYLNGYFGHFFAFSYLGNINWIAILIIGYFIATIKKRTKWELSFMIFYILALILVGVKGYFNRRYSVTILPITITMVVYYLWLFFEHFRFQRMMKYIIVIMLTIILFNDVKYILGFGKPQPLKVELNNKISYYQKALNFTNKVGNKLEKIKNGTANYNQLYIFPYYFIKNNLNNNLQRFFVFKSKPTEVIKFMNNLKLPPGEKFVNNNLPFQYYFTNKPGLYYWCEDDVYYTPKGKSQLIGKYKGKALCKHLIKDLKATYILTYNVYDLYNLEWFHFVNTYCTVVFCDDSGYFVYKVNEYENW